MRRLCVVSLVWSSVFLLVSAQGLGPHMALAADEDQKKTAAPAGDGTAAPAAAKPSAEAKSSPTEQPSSKSADGDSHDGDSHDGDSHDGDAHDGESHEGGAHDGEAHESGVPLSFKADLAFWSLIVFLIFVFVLRVFAWQPLAAGLDQRESGIRADIAAAEEARVQAEQMLADHTAKLDAVQDEVREILAEARRDAEHTKQEIIAEAQREAELTKERSVAEIERARDAALRDVFDTLSEQVVGATEHVLSRALTDEDQQRFIGDALAQFTGGSDS